MALNFPWVFPFSVKMRQKLHPCSYTLFLSLFMCIVFLEHMAWYTTSLFYFYTLNHRQTLQFTSIYNNYHASKQCHSHQNILFNSGFLFRYFLCGDSKQPRAVNCTTFTAKVRPYLLSKQAKKSILGGKFLLLVIKAWIRSYTRSNQST